MIPTMLVFMMQQSVDKSAQSMSQVYANTVLVMDMEERARSRGPAVVSCVSSNRAKIIRLHEGATKEYQAAKDAADRLDPRLLNVHANNVSIAAERAAEIVRLTQSCFSDWRTERNENKAVAPAQLDTMMDIQEYAPEASPS